MIPIPENCAKITVHFRLPGRLLWPYAGIESLRNDTAEQAGARAEYARKFPGERLFKLEPRDKGLISGASVKALEHLKLVRATVQERCSKERTYTNVSRDGTEYRGVVKSHPYCWFTFVFVKHAFPNTQVVGTDAKLFFEKQFCRGWTEIEVHRNPVVKNDVVTKDCALEIGFGCPADLPKCKEFGKEIVCGIHMILNKTYKMKARKTPPEERASVE